MTDAEVISWVRHCCVQSVAFCAASDAERDAANWRHRGRISTLCIAEDSIDDSLFQVECLEHRGLRVLSDDERGDMQALEHAIDTARESGDEPDAWVRVRERARAVLARHGWNNSLDDRMYG